MFFLQKANSIFSSVQLGFEVGLNNENFKSIDKVFKWAKSQTNLRWIVITDSEKEVFASHPKNIKIDYKIIQQLLTINNLEKKIFIVHGKWKTKNDYGHLYIAFNTDLFKKQQKKILKEISITVAILLTICIIFTIIFSYSISSPLKSLYQVTSDIMNGQLNKRVNENGGSLEISSVSKSFNKMVGQLLLEQEKSDKLLLNILPEKIAKRLKSMKKNETIADNYYNCSVLFCDIVGFTPLSATMSAEELVKVLNHIFSKIDDLSHKYNLEKIKTIGDCYMVAGGLLDKTENHVHNICHMGLDIIKTIENVNKELNLDLNIRVGIHVGPATAGVIGKQKFIYDLWGDSVNTASRMESHGAAGKVHVSQAVFKLIHNDFIFTKRDIIQVKGKGQMQTYFLDGTSTS